MSNAVEYILQKTGTLALHIDDCAIVPPSPDACLHRQHRIQGAEGRILGIGRGHYSARGSQGVHMSDKLEDKLKEWSDALAEDLTRMIEARRIEEHALTLRLGEPHYKLAPDEDGLEAGMWHVVNDDGTDGGIIAYTFHPQTKDVVSASFRFYSHNAIKACNETLKHAPLPNYDQTQKVN